MNNMSGKSLALPCLFIMWYYIPRKTGFNEVYNDVIKKKMMVIHIVLNGDFSIAESIKRGVSMGLESILHRLDIKLLDEALLKKRIEKEYMNDPENVAKWEFTLYVEDRREAEMISQKEHLEYPDDNYRKYPVVLHLSSLLTYSEMIDKAFSYSEMGIYSKANRLD